MESGVRLSPYHVDVTSQLLPRSPASRDLIHQEKVAPDPSPSRGAGARGRAMGQGRCDCRRRAKQAWPSPLTFSCVRSLHIFLSP